MNKKTIFLLCACFTLIACSTTPGDAALQSGHPEQAADLYRKGAQQGDDVAALKLGLLLEEDRVSPSNYGSASYWYQQACELDNVAGCHNAGVASEYGTLGAEQDYERARQFYLKAAEAGYMQSQYNLASLYANEYFIDPETGLYWMEKAMAQAEDCKAQPLCQWILEDPPGHREALLVQLENSKP